MSKNIKTVIEQLLPVESNWKLKLLNNWHSVLGNLNTKVHLEKMYDDTLVLSVADSCWLQELYLLSPMILQQINAVFDKPYVKQLKFKKAGLPLTKHTTRKKNIERKIATIQLSSHEKKALAHIKDQELAQALEQFLIRCYQEK